jgi:arsenite methyltransferase
MLESLYPWRDEILDRARLKPGETLLDVGAGDGLVAFGAVDRLGPSGRVIFSDISQDLLDHCREAAAAEGVLGRCAFARAPADSLGPIADASADVVTTRSVLIYVQDKATALREFYRVLRPGGRVSLFEPINRLMHDPDRPFGYDTSPVAGLAQRVRAAYESIQPPGSDPMTDFDERDLVRHAEHAGFPDVSLDLRLSLKPAREPCAWETFLAASGNPLVPPLGEVMTQVLSPEERAAFTAVLKPLVESGDGQQRSAVAFLTATKPA